MASINLSGILTKPTGGLAVGDQLRFIHKSTTGNTIQGAVSELKIGTDGTYNIDLEYGLVLVEYMYAKSQTFESRGIATVNQSNPATSIPELLNALVPVSSPELIEFQVILADCVKARDEAVAAADSVNLINDLSQAYDFSTVAEAKASTVVLPINKRIVIADYATGNNSGTLFFSIVAGGTGTDDGGTYINLPLTGLQLKQNMKLKPTIKDFGAVGNYNRLAQTGADDTTAIANTIAAFPNSNVIVPRGIYKSTQELRIPWTYGFRLSGDLSTSIDSPAQDQKGSTIVFIGCNGLEMGNIAQTEKTNNITIEHLSLVGDGVGPALPNGKLTTPPTAGTVGIISSGQAGFHGDFKFIDVHVEYFESGMFTNLLGWVYMKNCKFQNNFNGAQIQANVIHLDGCLFYQNGRITDGSLDLNNFSGAYIDTLTYGLFVKGTSIVLTSVDYEDNTIGLRIGQNASLGETEVTINGGYFESAKHSHIWSDTAAVSMSSALFNDDAGTTRHAYFNRGMVDVRTTPNINIIANNTQVFGDDTCKGSTLAHIRTLGFNTPTDWTAEFYVKARTVKGYPKVSTGNIDYQFVTTYNKTLSDITESVQTSTISTYIEPNRLRLTVDQSGGSASYTIPGIAGVERDLGFTIAFVSPTKKIRVILSTDSFIVDIDEEDIEVDEHGVSTLQFLIKGFIPSGTTRVIVQPGGGTNQIGDYIDIISLSYQLFEMGSPSDYLSLGDSLRRYGFSAPTIGAYVEGSTVTNRGWTAGEPHGWIYGDGAWQPMSI